MSLSDLAGNRAVPAFDDPRRWVIWAARLWVGTPFLHQGRSFQQGVDCVGLLTQINKTVFGELIDRTDYGRMPSGEELRRGLQAFLVETFWRERAADLPVWGPADVLMFRFGARRTRQHVGIATERGLIHAHQGGRRHGWPGGKVVEVPIDQKWIAAIQGVYRWPAIARKAE